MFTISYKHRFEYKHVEFLRPVCTVNQKTLDFGASLECTYQISHTQRDSVNGKKRMTHIVLLKNGSFCSLWCTQSMNGQGQHPVASQDAVQNLLKKCDNPFIS